MKLTRVRRTYRRPCCAIGRRGSLLLLGLVFVMIHLARWRRRDGANLQLFKSANEPATNNSTLVATVVMSNARKTLQNVASSDLQAIHGTMANPKLPLLQVSKNHLGLVPSHSLVEGKPFLVNRTRPAFSSLCKNSTAKNITAGNCQFDQSRLKQHRIFDYAVMGFAKCGSTTMAQTLGRLAQAPRKDTCINVQKAIVESYNGGWQEKGLYGSAPKRKNQQILTGIKCPSAIEIMRIIRSWTVEQPETLIVVGIRHPVLAFQSFYNMLVQNGRNMKDPDELLPSCGDKGAPSCNDRGCPGKRILCADRVKYHVSLAKLGKTPLVDKEELALLPFSAADRAKNIATNHYNVTNPIFLYEVSQLSHSNTASNQKFWSDLSNLLDLPFHIQPETVRSVLPGEKNLTTDVQEERNKRKINICETKHDKLRSVLQGWATQTATWICDYFLHGERVFVSPSPEVFCSTFMEGWKEDPCSGRTHTDEISSITSGGETTMTTL